MLNSFNKNRLLAFTGVVIYLGVNYSVLIFFGDQKSTLLASEDGFFETLTAIFFLFSSAIFLYIFFKSKSGNDFYFYQTKRNVFFLLLGILFFFGFGEEISWGQRIFNIETPETLKSINMQNEINIHNLKIFHGLNSEGIEKSFWGKITNIDRLFSLFWFSFCFLIPILNVCWPRLAKTINRICLPVVPLWLGVAFIVNYTFSKILQFSGTYLGRSIVEIKECNFAFLFLLLGIYFAFIKR